MKRMSKLVVVLLALLCLMGTACAETKWMSASYNSGGTNYGVLYTADDSLFKGSYDGTDILAQLTCSGALDGISYFYTSVAIKDKDNTYSWQNNTGSDAFFDIDITDSNNHAYHFFGYQMDGDSGIQMFNSESAFNAMEQYGDRSRLNCGEIIALLMTEQNLDFVVSNQKDGWAVEFTADMSGFNYGYNQVYGDYLRDQLPSVTSLNSNNNPDIVGINATSASTWGYGVSNDEFGDPIQGAGFVANMQHVEGTFGNSATTGSPLWADIRVDQEGLSFWFFEYQNINNLYRNSFSIYDKYFTVKFKVEEGKVYSFFCFMLVDDCYLHVVENRKIYDRIDNIENIKKTDYDEILALFTKGQILKVAITAESGMDKFNFSVDTHGFAEAYQNACGE